MHRSVHERLVGPLLTPFMVGCSLAFVGGIMTVVAYNELIPQAKMDFPGKDGPPWQTWIPLAKMYFHGKMDFPDEHVCPWQNGFSYQQWISPAT